MVRLTGPVGQTGHQAQRLLLVGRHGEPGDAGVLPGRPPASRCAPASRTGPASSTYSSGTASIASAFRPARNSSWFAPPHRRTRAPASRLWKFLVRLPHPAHVQGDLRLRPGGAALTSSVIITRHSAWISKSFHDLPAPGPPEALLDPRLERLHPPGDEPRGSQPSASSAVSRILDSLPLPSQIGRSALVCRIDVSGLPNPSTPRRCTAARSRALLGYRRLAPIDLSHDLHVVPQPPVRRPPGLAVPALDDLRPGDSEPGDDPVAAGQRVDGLDLHGRHGRLRPASCMIPVPSRIRVVTAAIQARTVMASEPYASAVQTES